MELNKSQERERNIYQLVAIGCFFAFIFNGWKYVELRNEYSKAEKQKVSFCIENRDLCQKNSVLTEVNKHYSNVIDKMRENEK